MQKGGALEELVENLAVQLRLSGQGILLKQNVLWVNHGGRVFPKKGAPVDFLGVIKGIPIAIECKETASDRIQFTESHFSEKEKAFLSDFEKAGGRAFLIFAFWKHNSIYIIPYRKFIQYDKKTITNETARKLGKKVGMGTMEFVKIVVGQ
ncbi:recombination protein U [Caldanaerobacter subterraneus subsp. tengcongensis MB4]|uniref:Holliday junction resolvase RecU n=1 Tax=Caldanaerobacter subterraneus subsp. tengcongensis (strain DSM 15242 / JCM 11007 / NBRC 100824 / MB4) TaxID=273068 RepID=Q8R8A6_CALS4|nr:Holliday junction resolvase RecU [Caldanaerobacter subterraneus]AAM25275.1 Penicillin-binding protein-related factor A, putative recombinase [Caldanaerobacter subterraneus subsp. tengcongensis MB4]MBE3578966.1 Holliday junction resolvase RecU [Caldanaerobacter subterraneus]MCS3915128.1 recombination protein U [Caldanaerobacter subterraneus subsp. tengcongensis MB4]